MCNRAMKIIPNAFCDSDLFAVPMVSSGRDKSHDTIVIKLIPVLRKRSKMMINYENNRYIPNEFKGASIYISNRVKLYIFKSKTFFSWEKLLEFETVEVHVVSLEDKKLEQVMDCSNNSG